MGKFVCILSVIFLTFFNPSLADITSTTCTPGTAGDEKCQAVDANAVCPVSTTKCACKDNYFLSSDKLQCLQKITTVDCTTGAAGTTKCQEVDSNSECPANGDKCACKKEYTGTDSCTKVLGGTCPADGGCTGSVDNSVCTEQKCECAANFIEESAVCKTAAESSATSAWLTTSLIVTSLLIYLPRLILL